MIQTPGANVIQLFTVVIYNFCNKMESLLLASLSTLVYRLWVRPGAYPRVEYLEGVSYGYAPTLLAKTIVYWKGL